MKRYLKLSWHLLVITFALYLIRPAEALCKAAKYGSVMFIRCFKDEWSYIFQKDGWKSLELYKGAFDLFKESK